VSHATPFHAATEAGAIVGISALDVVDGLKLGSLRADEWFPLASAENLVIGSAVVDAVSRGELRWNDLVPGVELDPDSTSHELYPHMWGQTELELREIVEMAVGALDHHCALALVALLGGWESLLRRVGEIHGEMRLSPRPNYSAARLDTMAALARSIALGHSSAPRLWRPVVSGMVRQIFQSDEIPAHHVLNVQGGLEASAMDIGILGDVATANLVAYAVATKEATDPARLLAVYETMEDVVRDLYREHVAESPPGRIVLTQIDR